MEHAEETPKGEELLRLAEAIAKRMMDLAEENKRLVEAARKYHDERCEPDGPSGPC